MTKLLHLFFPRNCVQKANYFYWDDNIAPNLAQEPCNGDWECRSQTQERKHQIHWEICWQRTGRSQPAGNVPTDIGELWCRHNPS